MKYAARHQLSEAHPKVVRVHSGRGPQQRFLDKPQHYHKKDGGQNDVHKTTSKTRHTDLGRGTHLARIAMAAAAMPYRTRYFLASARAGIDQMKDGRMRNTKTT